MLRLKKTQADVFFLGYVMCMVVLDAQVLAHEYFRESLHIDAALGLIGVF